jgi:hypothetical protein
MVWVVKSMVVPMPEFGPRVHMPSPPPGGPPVFEPPGTTVGVSPQVKHKVTPPSPPVTVALPMWLEGTLVVREATPDIDGILEPEGGRVVCVTLGVSVTVTPEDGGIARHSVSISLPNERRLTYIALWRSSV